MSNLKFPDIHFEGGRQMGVIAQDVEKVFPEAVSKNKKGIRSVAYTMLIAPIIESIKELYADIVGQNRRIASLEEQNATKDKEIKDLRERLEKIESTLKSK
jgi:hypothetical protein